MKRIQAGLTHHYNMSHDTLPHSFEIKHPCLDLTVVKSIRIPSVDQWARCTSQVSVSRVDFKHSTQWMNDSFS